MILQNCGVSFGQLETPAKNGDPVYSTTFTDASGFTVAVLWEGSTLRDFFEKAAETLAGVTPSPKAKLHVARANELPSSPL